MVTERDLLLEQSKPPNTPKWLWVLPTASFPGTLGGFYRAVF